MNNRPSGITILAYIYLALGVVSLIWSGLVFGIGGLSSFFGNVFGAESMASFGSSNTWSGFLGIVAAVVQIVVGFGLLGMKKWAWYLALIGIAITVLQGIVGLFSGGLFATLCGALWLIIPILIVIYLLNPGIRKAFAVG